MISIKDVARLANVAPSTVSNVINNKNNVKEETVLRVYKAIEELEYTPNFLARCLKGKKTLIVGAVIPDIGNPFYTMFVRGIEDVAHQFNYTVVLCNTDDDVKKEHVYISQLKMKALDGFIICSSLLSEKELLSIGTPVVLVDKKTDNDQLCTININNQKAGYMATEELINGERKKIGVITGPLYFRHFQERLAGYQQALNDHKIGLDYNLVAEAQPNRKGGYNAMAKLFGISPDIEAVFAMNDLMAIGAIKFLSEKGVRVPQDAAVIGMDNSEAAMIVNPELSTIDQPQYKIGEMAMQHLIRIIQDEMVEPMHVVIEPKLILRESS